MTNDSGTLIEPWSRCVALLAALALAVLATTLLFRPPTLRQFPPQCATADCATGVQDRPETTVLALYGLCGVLALLGVNGRRFSAVKFAGNEVSSEAVTPEKAEAAAKFLSSPGLVQDLKDDKAEDIAGADAPGLPASARRVHVDGLELAVVTPAEVPLKILVAAVTKLQAEGRRVPPTLADLDFAARRTGQGNHPWKLKFYSVPEVISVAMGGRRKEEPSARLVALEVNQ